MYHKATINNHYCYYYDCYCIYIYIYIGKGTDWDYVHELVTQGKGVYEVVSLVPSKCPHIKSIKEMCSLHIQGTKGVPRNGGRK